MSITTFRGRLCLGTALAMASGTLFVLPATARPDPGPSLDRQVTAATTSASSSEDDGRCHLRRVGTQFVKCDNLTGNGVAAPTWVIER